MLPEPPSLDNPVKGIDDYPLLFKEKLFLRMPKQHSALIPFSMRTEKKVEENAKDPSEGIGQELKTGIYMLEIEVNDRTLCRKIIKGFAKSNILNP